MIAKIYEFQLEEGYRNNVKYIVEKGRVTIDGASLTVIDVNDMRAYFQYPLYPIL